MDNKFIEKLIKKNLLLMGSDWRKDESATDSPLPGYKYVGEKLVANCSDFFFWGAADTEDVPENGLGDIQKAIDDCDGNLETGVLLFCARQRGMRPQGAYYTYIPKKLWPLFDSCGEERKVDSGNPYKPGEYQSPIKA